MAVKDGIIGAAWEDIEIVNDSTVRHTLRFAVSTDYGQTFSPSVIVDSSGQPQYPSLVWKHDIFYVAWRAVHRRTPTGPYLEHMWFSYSRDSGKAFVPFVDAVPDDTNDVIHNLPSVWVNETEKAYVAWGDARWDPFFQSVSHLFVSVGTPAVAKGDLNFDGAITATDIALELNAVFRGQSFPAPFHRADGNCDGRLSPTDVVLLLYRWYLDRPFPCT